MAGLYIHIPFCAQRCAYCDFYSTVSASLATDYLNALEREMEARRSFIADGRLDTVYIGGGTPSLLSPEQLQRLLNRTAELWDCSDLREVTVETNPEDLTDDYLSRLSGTGFNRLSIGIQSFDDGLLRLMNRRHDAARAKNAVREAQRTGFDNISVDLIFGIPGMTHRQWERSLDEAIGLGVQHISAYHLTIEPATLFGKMVQRDEENKSPAAFRPIKEAESERQYEALRRKLGDAGFEHYEISNFALPGRRAVHNSAYWSGKPYLGVGPSAHSYDGARRREWALPDIGKYISGAGIGNIYENETLSDAELFNERIMTGLRTCEGITNYETAKRLTTGQKLQITRDKKQIEQFIKDGLLVKSGNNIAIPPEKFLLSDYIISALFE
jgi:oxygen-independent coproporphyrinogen-3 oxidase